MIPALLASVGLPILVRLARGALSRIDNPVARAAADALGETDAAIASRAITSEQVQEANETVRALAQEEGENFRAAIRQVNATFRREIASDDAYVRRWRPTFGYAVAITWTVQVGGLVYAIVEYPAHAGEIIGAMASLSVIWGVALSVLGVNVVKRSRDKEVAAGAAPPEGLLAGLIRRLAGSGKDGA